jgi:hypothetical protein
MHWHAFHGREQLHLARVFELHETVNVIDREE